MYIFIWHFSGRLVPYGNLWLYLGPRRVSIWGPYVDRLDAVAASYCAADGQGGFPLNKAVTLAPTTRCFCRSGEKRTDVGPGWAKI